MAKLPTILIVLALMLVPAAIAIERTNPSLWTQRLFAPTFNTEPNRHTPVHPIETFLPPRLTQDTVFTKADSPVLLPGTTRVEPGITLTFEPGVALFAHEWGTLDIYGTLNLQGTKDQPVVLTSNEQHQQNRVWNGIFFRPGSRGDIDYAIFEHATPAISCLPESSVTYTHLRITQTPTEIYSEGNTCPAYTRTF